MTAIGYRFGEFHLAAAARELWQGDQLIALPPKSFDCLVYLIEHHERAVGRDELISAVWGRTDVSDDLLAQTLLRARRAVGDTGNEQRAIRTVPRFGYRWILPLDETVAPARTSHASPMPAHAQPGTMRTGRLPHRRWIVLSLLFAAAATALGLWLLQPHLTSTRRAGPAGVLVLPVQHSGGGGEAAWLRLGAMDYLATRLRDRAHLQVLPSEQTLLLVGKDIDPTDPGVLHQLELATGANHVLAPYATFERGEWTFLLDVYHAGGVRSYEAHGAYPLEAATIAIDRFVADLGIGAHQADSMPAATVEPMKRIDAAMLAGDLGEARRLIDALPAQEHDKPETAVRVGQIAFRAGDLQAARNAFEPLTGVATAASTRAQALSGLGAVATRQDRFDEAEQRYSAAITVLATLNEASPDLVGNAYSGRGVANAARDRFDAALADFGRARVELERAGDRIGTATVDTNLGLLEAGRGHYRDAVQAFNRAIAIFTRFGVRDHLAAALLSKSDAQLTLLDNAEALATVKRAQEISTQLENPLLKWRVSATHIAALLANGELDAAQTALDAAGRNPDGKSTFDLLRVRLLLERGNLADAARHMATMLGHDRSTPAGVNPADVLQLAVVAVRRGAPPALLEQALGQARLDDGGVARIELALARDLGLAQRLALGNEGDATQAFADALAEADRASVPSAFVAAAIAYADHLVKQGRSEAAATMVGRLVPYAERDYAAAHAIAALSHELGNASLARTAQAQMRRLAGERDPAVPL